MIHQVFPTRIYQNSLKPASWSEKRWRTFLSKLKEEVYVFVAQDEAGHAWCEKFSYLGYTSYGSISRLDLVSPNFHQLEEFFRAHVFKYAKLLNYDVSIQELSINSFWMNVMPEGCYHSSHIHPLSIISGTFYLDVDQNSSTIKFEDPRLSNFMNQPPMKNSSRQTSPYHVEIKPLRGELVLFESWLRHEVPLQKSKKERISLSFNYGWNPREQSSHGLRSPIERGNKSIRKKTSPQGY
jgi:uncharacterized protein (TIGR02466 family)